MAILGLEENMHQLYPGVTLKEFERSMGRELGVVRISLGLGSNFRDARKCVQFARLIATEQTRNILWDDWIENTSPDLSIGQAL
jgi:hypothetical protein